MRRRGLLTLGIVAAAVLTIGGGASSSDFDQRESAAYSSLYQESAGRKTEDQAITIPQGRCVGGSTTMNWTRRLAQGLVLRLGAREVALA